MSDTRILFDAGPMIDVSKSGVGYYTDSLIRSLASHPDAPSLTGYYFDFMGRNHKNPSRIQGVQYFKNSIVPGKLLSAARRFGFQLPLELFAPQKANWILSTNFVSLPTIRRTKKAVVVYDLSFLDCPEYAQPANLKFLRKFCPQSIVRADVIITISKFTEERLRYFFPDLKAEIITTPIPPLPISAASRDLSTAPRLAALGIKEKNYILYLGTIEPRKNIVNLISAYEKLPEAIRKQYSLVLAGGKGWKDQDIVAAIAKAQSEGYDIIQTGYITDLEKHVLYGNAACFALPSHYEGFGMPILEAMQYELPVAVSDIPVFKEVAGSAALYFDENNPASIADTIIKVLEPANSKPLVSEEQKHLKKFSWEYNAQEVLGALKKN